MSPDEVSKITDIDRSERIRTGYRFVGGKLESMDVNWDSQSWSMEGDGDHSVDAQIKFCQQHLDRKGKMYGAFADGKLVGIGLVQHEIEEETAQLAYLHVSNQYRQQGIGRQITDALMSEARRAGAKRMYVSAVPSGSAIRFYLSQGFRPTETPIPELYELEPDDIHMTKEL